LSTILKISPLIEKNIKTGRPVISIETAILTHGMPIEGGKRLVRDTFRLCKKIGVSPAFLSVFKGSPCVGLPEKNLLSLMGRNDLKKISNRNIGIASALRWSGGTTVSAGAIMSKRAGISVFCTGGMGGVHRGLVENFDISQDLLVLSKTPIIIITSGAKAVLDLKKTFEALEFLGVPVVGYQTNEFPSFWSRGSGLALEAVAESPEDIASIWKHHCRLGSRSALVVANPVPEKNQIPYSEISGIINSAISKAESLGVTGPDLTPFLLKFLNEKTEGRCLKTNISLAVNNVALGASISKLI
jgi:pseudouridine-5'-phosphate glycosidase